MGTLDCIETILRKTGRAMSAVELLPLMRASGEWECRAANPENSIRAQLRADIIRKADRSRFCSPERGLFALNGNLPAPSSVPAASVASVASAVPAGDLGYFYVLSNISLADKWCKIVTSRKPIDPNGLEINDPAVPVPYDIISAYKTHRYGDVRVLLFGMLEQQEKKMDSEPHAGFFRVKPLTAHYVMVSLAEQLGERSGIYEAYKHKKTAERAPSVCKPLPLTDGSVEIYVGNLSYELNDDGLRELFAKYGQVLSVRIKTNYFNGKSKGFGFVRMAAQSDAERACAALNGTEVDGRSIRVNIARRMLLGEEAEAESGLKEV